MTGEALHEAGIAVSAAMPASHIGIDTVVKTGDGRLGQNGFGKDLPNFHIQYYNGGGRKSKVFEWNRLWVQGIRGTGQIRNH
jgi:hypothetical protein